MTFYSFIISTMKNKKIILASLFGAFALTMWVSTYAYQWNPGVSNSDCTDTERHAAVQEMFKNKDYESFKLLYADKWVMKKITSEEKFLKFAELYQAWKDWNTVKATQLKSELNLGQKKMDWSGKSNWWKGAGSRGQLNK